MHVGHGMHVGHDMHVGHGACMCSCWRGSGCCCTTSIPAVGIAFRLASRCFLRCFRWRRRSAAENTPHAAWLASHRFAFTHGVLSIRQRVVFFLGCCCRGWCLLQCVEGGGGGRTSSTILFFLVQLFFVARHPPPPTTATFAAPTLNSRGLSTKESGGQACLRAVMLIGRVLPCGACLSQGSFLHVRASRSCFVRAR